MQHDYEPVTVGVERELLEAMRETLAILGQDLDHHLKKAVPADAGKHSTEQRAYTALSAPVRMAGAICAILDDKYFWEKDMPNAPAA